MIGYYLPTLIASDYYLLMKTKYFCLEPARFKLDGGAMFGIIPKPLWNKVHPADDLNRIELALRLILVQDGDKNILIDTGIGDYHGEKFDQRFAIVGKASPLELALAQIGLKPDDITDLIISHLHFDHVGGIGKFVDGKIEPILKKATIHLHKSHYEYSKNPSERDAGSFQIEYFEPILKWYQEHNQIHFVDQLEGSLVGRFNYKCSMGHTPFLLHAYDDQMIYMADLIPTSNHVHIPWVMGYDISPAVTTVDKRNFLKLISEKNLVMIFEHDPLFFGATIKKDIKGEFICDQKFDYKNKSAYSILD